VEGSLTALRRAAVAVLAAAVAGCAARAPGLRVRLPAIDEARAREERAAHYDRAMEQLRAYRERLDRVYDALVLESASLCGPKVVPWLGVATIGPKDFVDWSQHLETQADLRASAQRVLAMGEGLTVFAVAAGAPAGRAGVQPGDVLERVNGRRVRRTPDLRKALEKRRTGPARLTLRRGGAALDLEVPYEAACDVPVFLSLGPAVWAFWTRQGITVSSGMMDRLGSDEELAFTLAHELGHELEDRTDASPKELERRADYLGCYLAARAGYPVSALPGFWKRWAAIAPLGIEPLGPTHPSTAERSLLLEATVAEIAAKQAAGLPLLPTLEP
jgi:hypothetical protein